MELFEFGSLELDLEVGFDSDDEVDVVEGVPLGDVDGAKRRGEDEGVVFEEVVEDSGELGVDFFRLHV